jgi:hypothetical protein
MIYYSTRCHVNSENAGPFAEIDESADYSMIMKVWQARQSRRFGKV